MTELKSIKVSKPFHSWLWEKYRSADETIEGTIKRLIKVKKK